MIEAISIALLLCFLNVAAALIVIRIAYQKDQKKFSKYVLSSLVIRYFVMVVFSWLCIVLFDPDKLVFSLTLITATFVFLLAEVVYIHRYKSALNLKTNLN